jgi:phosphate:Na+ symporter
MTSSDLPRQIANAHTIFNVVVSLMLMPFVKQIAWMSKRLVPERAKEAKPRLTAYIDEMQYSVPAVALTEAARELTHLGEAAAQMLEQACQALLTKDTHLARRVIAREDEFIDPVFKALVDFVNNLLMQEDLTPVQQKRCFQLKNLLMDIERIGDMAEDIAGYAMERVANNLSFSPQAMEDMEKLWPQALLTYTTALKAFETSDKEMAQHACDLESAFDHMYWQTRQRHIERLEAGICKPEANVVFTEMLRLLERVSDHADNLGVSVVRS